MAHVDRRVPMRARHPLIHFGDHRFGVAGCGQRAVHRGAQAYEPVLIRRRYLHQHHIQRKRPAHEQPLDLAQEDRRVIRAPGRHCLANIGSQKQSAMTKMSFELRLCIVGAAQRHHVNNFNIAHFGGPRNKRIHERRRRSASRLDPYASAGTHRLKRLPRVHAFALVFLAPAHSGLPPEECVPVPRATNPLRSPPSDWTSLSRSRSQKHFLLAMEKPTPETRSMLGVGNNDCCDGCHL